MSPQDIAELIILVTDASLKDSISIEAGGRLNKALWKLAFLHQVEKDVNDILQRISTDEMEQAIEEILKETEEVFSVFAYPKTIRVFSAGKL